MDGVYLRLKEELFDLLAMLKEKESNEVIGYLARLKYEDSVNKDNSKIEESFFQTQKFSLPSLSNNKGKEINEITYQLANYISTFPVFDNYKKFYNILSPQLQGLLYYFKYKEFKKEDMVYDHGENTKNIYIIVCGKVEHKQYKSPTFLRNLLLKVKKMNLDIIISHLLKADMDYLFRCSKKENPEQIVNIINKIKTSGLGEDLILKLLEEKYLLPKTSTYSTPGDIFGLDEVVSETRKTHLDTTAKALTPLHVLYVDKHHFLRFLGRNLINSLSEKYEYMETILPCMKDSYKAKLLLRRVRHLV